MRSAMSRYFVLPEEGVGPGGDIFFRRHSIGLPGWYRLHLDDVSLGLVHKGLAPWQGWVACSENFDAARRVVEGFTSRWYVGRYVIQHHGCWLHNEKEQDRMHLQLRKAIEEAESGPAC